MIFCNIMGFITLWSMAWAYDVNDIPLQATPPKSLEQVGIFEKLGENIDLGLTFVDDRGETVPLRRYFDGHHPVLINLVYYSCPNLCGLHLNGLKDGLIDLSWTAGKEFQVVTVSIEPKEDWHLAQKKKDNYINAYGRTEAREGWHFLTGREDQIHQLADQLGFKYRWDTETAQWAHAAGAFVMTPTGKISRVLFGIQFNPSNMKLALGEAGENKVGTLIDRLIMFCFQFDPHKNKYTIYAFNMMKLGAGLMVLLLAVVLVPFWLRQRLRVQSP